MIINILVLVILFGACIGLTQLFIAKVVNKINTKKLILLTLISGLILSALNFALLENNPRSLNSAELIKAIDNMPKDIGAEYGNVLNLYKLELHKRYSLSAGTLVFAFYALMTALLLQHRKIGGLVISVISCILYWSFLVLGENLSIKLGSNGIINVWFPTLLFVYLTINFYLVHELFKLHKRNIANAAKTESP